MDLVVYGQSGVLNVGRRQCKLSAQERFSAGIVDKMDDTAQEIASLEDLLHSAHNRVEIAQILLKLGREELLPTVLEDFLVGCQFITDFCIKEK